jgi:hypothetical protein
MRSSLVVSAALFLWTWRDQTSPDAESRLVSIRLQRSTAVADVRVGMSNIFFAADSSHGTDARVEVATVMEPRGAPAVRAVRVGTADGTWEYRVDTNGDGQFADEQPLLFHDVNGLAVAETEVDVPWGDGLPGSAKVPLQIAWSRDGYVYASLRLTLAGSWRIGARNIAVQLRPRFRGLDDWVVAVDLNGDGVFRERRSPSDTIASHPAEDVGLLPFRVGALAWRVAGVDLRASTVRMERVPDTLRAPVEGFRAPALPMQWMDAGVERRDRARDAAFARDSVTVLEFWSVNCPFSEQVRPRINQLIQEYSGRRVRWIAVPRERDTSVVELHRAAHPSAARQAITTAAEWERWNPQTITPLFVVVDGTGRVILRESGADRVPLLRKAVDSALARR